MRVASGPIVLEPQLDLLEPMARLLDVVGPIPLAALERLVHLAELVLRQQGAGHARGHGELFDVLGEGGDAVAEAGVAGSEGRGRAPGWGEEEGGGRGGEEDEEDEGEGGCGSHGGWEEGVEMELC